MKYITLMKSEYPFYFQKIERLKSELHLLDAQDKPQNKHIIFVDSKKDGNCNVQCIIYRALCFLY